MELKWAMVPQEATQEMCAAAVVFANGNAVYKNVAAEALKIEESIYGEVYAAMLAAAPQPPHISMTAEEARTFQGWAGMDGATAFHLIERHASGWGEVGRMMDAWLQANSKAPNLEPVIAWLENGCDPKEAAKELRIYQAAGSLKPPNVADKRAT